MNEALSEAAANLIGGFTNGPGSLWDAETNLKDLHKMVLLWKSISRQGGGGNTDGDEATPSPRDLS